MKTNIRWTSAEEELVLEHALKVMHKNMLKPYEALKYAQVILPEKRRRAFSTHSSCINLTDKLKSRFQNYFPPTEKPVAAQPIPMEEPSSAPTEVSLDGLIEAIVERIAGMVKAQVRLAVKTLEHEFRLEKHDPTYDATNVHKPRIVIIGLLNDQVHAISKEFNGPYSIKCIDTDRAMGMTPPDADAYLLMKNFINHPLYHKYQRFPNHVLIDGGMSTLRMWLNTKGKEL
jgi:hypothetical protein